MKGVVIRASQRGLPPMTATKTGSLVCYLILEYDCPASKSKTAHAAEASGPVWLGGVGFIPSGTADNSGEASLSKYNGRSFTCS